MGGGLGGGGGVLILLVIGLFTLFKYMMRAIMHINTIMFSANNDQPAFIVALLSPPYHVTDIDSSQPHTVLPPGLALCGSQGHLSLSLSLYHIGSNTVTAACFFKMYFNRHVGNNWRLRPLACSSLVDLGVGQSSDINRMFLMFIIETPIRPGTEFQQR